MIKFIHVSHHTDIYDVYVHINSFQITIGEMLIMTYKKKHKPQGKGRKLYTMLLPFVTNSIMVYKSSAYITKPKNRARKKT